MRGGDIDVLCKQRAIIGSLPWQFIDGESSIGRCVAMVEDDEYDEMMARKAELAQEKIWRLLRPGARGAD